MDDEIDKKELVNVNRFHELIINFPQSEICRLQCGEFVVE